MASWLRDRYIPGENPHSILAKYSCEDLCNYPWRSSRIYKDLNKILRRILARSTRLRRVEVFCPAVSFLIKEKGQQIMIVLDRNEGCASRGTHLERTCNLCVFSEIYASETWDVQVQCYAWYCTFQKHTNSEVQTQTAVLFYTAAIIIARVPGNKNVLISQQDWKVMCKT